MVYSRTSVSLQRSIPALSSQGKKNIQYVNKTGEKKKKDELLSQLPAKQRQSSLAGLLAQMQMLRWPFIMYKSRLGQALIMKWTHKWLYTAGINQCHPAKQRSPIRAWLLLFLNSFLIYLFLKKKKDSDCQLGLLHCIMIFFMSKHMNKITFSPCILWIYMLSESELT